MNATQLIRKHIEEIPVGKPFGAAQMLQFGSRAAVDQALSRLSAQGGLIMRVTRGVYVRPKTNRYVGQVMPEPLEVAEALTQSKIEVSGAEAARHFQLTTQVPTQPVFYTAGPSRKFRMGQLQVCLKHVSQKKLGLAGTNAGLGLAALWYLGKHQVTSNVIEKIESKLPALEFEHLKASKSLMPAWMADALHKYENERHA
jgi:hypothetical protein